jgi:hypothetical protein
MLGALALQAGVYSLTGGYPLLSAIAFACVSAIWICAAVARGAMGVRRIPGAPYSLAGIVVTLLLTVGLTAGLVDIEVRQTGPPEAGAIPMTRRLLELLAHAPRRGRVPPLSVDPASKNVAAQLVGPNDTPRVVLRPPPKPKQNSVLFVDEAPLQVSHQKAPAIPFTGMYHLFPTSSGGLPPKSIEDTGTPLEVLYQTNSGRPMQTVAVRSFERPIDLTHCGKVSVDMTHEDNMLLLASLQLVGEKRMVVGGTVTIRLKAAQHETADFALPPAREPLLVRAIWIVFQRPLEPERNARVAVWGFDLVGMR